MSLAGKLIGFGLRQVLDVAPDNVIEAVVARFRDHSQTLPRALARANDRAWQSLGVALAGNGFLDRIKRFFASDGDDKGIREQVQLFLNDNAFSLGDTPDKFRLDCLDELKRLRKSGLLSSSVGSAAEIARQAAGFKRHADPQGLVAEAQRAVGQVADALVESYPNLARLLRTPTPAGPPLLAAAFCYFFRREVETNSELAHGLFFDGLRQLTASQAKAFGEVGQALDALGERFDQAIEEVLQELLRVRMAAEAAAKAAAGAERAASAAATAAAGAERAAAATQGGFLDLQAELQRLGGLHLANAEEVRRLLLHVLQHLAEAGMQRGEVRPQHSFSVRSEEERRAVKALLARFRQLPPEEQQQMPALLNGLGKLQIGTGDFDGAEQTFAEVVAAVPDAIGKAEASFNAYGAALEKRHWDEALARLKEAASLDPARFAPFPLHRYEPKRILGAGGFGTVVLCHDRHFDEDVVVKTLHAADLDRGLEDVFREARTLRRLSHPAIIGVRDCEFADVGSKARPYLVMDYFPGGTLEQFIEQRGTIATEQLLPVAAQIASGMRAAHHQNILHRDLKPANVLVRKEGEQWRVVIIDFGLALRKQVVETSMARASGEDTVLSRSVAGTLRYAPPEQLGEMRGVKAGTYSDVYAFGKTCCYALFRTTEPKSRHWKGIPKELVRMLEGCTEHELEHRLLSFEPVLKVLEEMQGVGGPGVLAKDRDGGAKSGASVQAVLEAPDEARWEAEPSRQEEPGRQAEQEPQQGEREQAETKRLEAEPSRQEEPGRQAEQEPQQGEQEQAETKRLEAEPSRQEEPGRQAEQEPQQGEREQAETKRLEAEPSRQEEPGRQAEQEPQQGEREQAETKRLEAEPSRQHEGKRGRQKRARREDGERKLARLWRDALNHTRGKPTAEDTAAADTVCREHGVPVERAREIVAEARERWQKEQPRKPRRGDLTAVSLGNGIEMKFAWIPPGTFLMGSPPSELERDDNETQHRVTLTKGYWLGIHQVTQAQWQAVMGGNPNQFKGGNLPVENVSWDDCHELVEKLGQKTRKRFRLPTEAEWEYACRAGTTAPFHFGVTISTDQANYDGNFTYGKGKKGVFRENTTPVGSFPANAWGLFDMHGNVWEWCSDWYGVYPSGDIKDPQGDVDGTARVLRGGSWFDYPRCCRSACRDGGGPGDRSFNDGCRVLLCLD